MSKFCFFTDPASLDAQDPTQAFGPAGVLSGQDQFRVTDVHTSSAGALPAIAICDGVLCAQEESPDTLTLILKPSQAPPFESPVVSYFIYKGVDKASLLTGDQILDEDAVRATDFTKRIAKEWKKQNADDLAGSSAALGLDRNASFLHDDGTSQVHIFTDNDPIDRLFTFPHKTVQLPTVAAGEIIGGFQSIGGFEVHLQRLGYKPKLEFARRADNQISVPSLTGGPWQADDSEFFAHWHAKEQVLAFMDPCAYFGSFVQSKLSKKSGSTAGTVKGSDIYQQILQTFANRNIAWLDIRNNYSYSYNLFGLYDDTIRFVHHSHASETSDKNFRAGLWPILKLQLADVPGSKRGSLHRTKLSLPVGLSTAPAVLVSKGFVKNLGPERPKSKAPAIARASALDTYYTPFRLAFPVIDENSQDVFTASYTRINLYERPHAATSSAPPLNIAGGEYLDGLFRLRDLRLDEDFAGNSLRFEIYDEEVLVDLDDQSGPTYASTVGVAEDANYVTLFAYPSYFLPNDSNLRLNKALPSWPATAVNTATGFISRLSNNFRSGTVTKKTFQPDDLPHDVDLIVVSNQSANNYNPITDRNSIQNFCFVVLNKANYNSLLGQVLTATDIDAALPLFLTIVISLEKRDAVNSVNYIEKILRATAFKMSSGAKAIPVHVTLIEGMIYQNADF
jgi:hypothetical protein